MTAVPASVVVVGGGLAGVSACAELRSRGYTGAITLLDAGDLLHDRPPLSKDFLLGAVDEQKITLQDGAWFAAHDIQVRLRSRARALRPADDRVEVDLDGGGTVVADVAVLALGGTARALPVPGGDLPAVHVLRTVDDARRLRERLVAGARVLVVGGGLIGAEVASTALVLGTHVTLVDPVDPPLAAAVGPDVARLLHAEHADRGIRVIAAGVERLEQTGPGTAVRATLNGGNEPVEADVVVVGIGIVPDTALAEAAGLRVNGGILVDAAHRTSHPRVYAAGDAARLTAPDGTPLSRTEHWEAAQRGGHAVAAAILGQDPPPPSAAWFWTDRHGHHVEVVGEMAEAERTVMRGQFGAGPFAVFGLAGNRCVGAVAVDDTKAVRAARRLIDRAVPVEADALADPATDLRRLIRG